METLLFLTNPPIRIHRETFTRCNFVRIPAIQHGFHTTNLLIRVIDNDDKQPKPFEPIIRIHPQTFLVELIFMLLEWDPSTGQLTGYLMPPQSGEVIIQGHPLSLQEHPFSVIALSHQ